MSLRTEDGADGLYPIWKSGTIASFWTFVAHVGDISAHGEKYARPGRSKNVTCMAGNEKLNDIVC